MERAFTRDQIDPSRLELLHAGRSANAYLSVYRPANTTWVIKDFKPCWPVLRNTWGQWLLTRELDAIRRLDGIDGVPRDAFRLDRFAFVYRFIPGCTIRDAAPERITRDYFLALEDLVRQLHARNVVHLDIRYRKNILVTEAGAPALLDFQTALILDRVPAGLHQRLKNIDLSGVYKQWFKRDPASIDEARKQFLARQNRRRQWWILKGYAGIKRPESRRRMPPNDRRSGASVIDPGTPDNR